MATFRSVSADSTKSFHHIGLCTKRKIMSALILKASIARLAQAVEEDGTRQGILRFVFVQPQLRG
jgi:hypothetical protein